MKKPQGVINVLPMLNIIERLNDTGVEGFMIELSVPGRAYLMISETKSDVEKWMRAITLVAKKEIKSAADLHLLDPSASSVKPQLSPEGLPMEPEQIDYNVFARSRNIALSEDYINLHSLPERIDLPPIPISTLNLSANRTDWVTFQQRNIWINGLTQWANFHLTKRDLHVNNLMTDLGDGVLIANLLEILTGGTVNHVSKPEGNLDKVKNITQCCTYIRDLGKDLPTIPPEAIVSGNVKKIVDLMWAIAFHFQIDIVEYRSLKGGNAILMWVKDSLTHYPINLSDFSSSWRDGMQFCALFDNFSPRFGYSDLQSFRKRNNIQLAFNLSNEIWGIPKIFAVEDLMAEDPSEAMVILYLSICFQLIINER
eukprot:TRINITY_DN9202_c0_g1_i2.p1 TRINITY_DN9202_c0_g1~~TRINITY_DN9202_c0_g1_i2.p1  ORF type:complete len:412 (-),score=69.98 TRINITY_DN9202_c0_g1_i2:17-1123(-)